jgi:cyclophilin family peptidyl-prolyl cis-trans isomerase
MGTITVVLEPEKAPLTVRNFLSYVDDGHYDGTIFHQVVDGYIVLGGGFTPQFEERPALEAVRNEAHNGLLNRRGTIAMARQADAIDSSTCQFFINLADNPELDHKDRDPPEAYGYCVFGRVTEGMEVLDKIGKVQVQDREGFQMAPVQPVAIRSIKRWH